MKPTLHIGEWLVDPIAGLISRDGETRRLRPKTMAVLLCLADEPGELLERDTIIERVWGRRLITDEPLTTCIAELRRSLEDQAMQPRYIQTLPKRGYRLVAEVSTGEPVDGNTATEAPPPTGLDATAPPAPAEPAGVSSGSRQRWLWLISALVVTAALLIWAIPEQPVEPPVGPAEVTATPTVAVLPFVNMSPQPENDYFGAGIAEEIINSLTHIEGLRVRSRTSSFALADQNLEVTRLAERLQVTHILEGSIRRSGDQYRITAQLIEVQADTHIWSHVFEKSMQNVFEIQGEIATRVSAALEIALNLEQKQQLGDAGTTNNNAYDLYLQGRQLLARRTTVSITAAVESFSRALELDPGYAQAYLGLADANLLLPQYNNRPGTDYLPKALAAVEKALQINPDLGEAYATLGGIRDEMHDIAGAEQAFLTAMERAPRYPTTYHWYGFLLNRIARLDEADRILRLAIEQDPLSSLLVYGLSSNLVALGRFDEAEKNYRRIIDRDPEFAWAYEGVAVVHWSGRGQPAAATPWFEKAIRYDPDSSYFRSMLGAVHLDMGDSDRAQEWIDGAMRIQPESYVARVHKALLHQYLDEDGPACDIALDVLRDDPRNYLALVIARNRDLSLGQPAAARARYAAAFPELFADEPRVDADNFQAAVDLVPVLRTLGEAGRAGLFLEAAWPIARDFPRNELPYRITDVKILTFQDRTPEALAVLEDSVDHGWRPYWWLFLKYDPALDDLRETPGFQALVRRLEE